MNQVAREEMIYRRPKDERSVVAQVAKRLEKLAMAMPINPADTAAKFAFAERGRRELPYLIHALNSIVWGPHADVDYVEPLDEEE